MTLDLYSPAFQHNEQIPKRYTCMGEDISPALGWKQGPHNTKSYALIMQDLDTPITHITHWILFNIPADKTDLPEALPSQQIFSDGMVQGKNSMRKHEYMGPCPPIGKHRYVFTLYALDTILEEDPHKNKRKLLSATQNHILDESELHGFFSKKGQ